MVPDGAGGERRGLQLQQGEDLEGNAGDGDVSPDRLRRSPAKGLDVAGDLEEPEESFDGPAQTVDAPDASWIDGQIGDDDGVIVTALRIPRLRPDEANTELRISLPNHGIGVAMRATIELTNAAPDTPSPARAQAEEDSTLVDRVEQRPAMEAAIEKNDIAGPEMFDQMHSRRRFPTIAPTAPDLPCDGLLPGDVVEHDQAGLREMAVGGSPRLISAARLAEGRGGVGRGWGGQHGAVDSEDATRKPQVLHPSP